jgi:parallel beta-helix repeat protein
MTVRNCVFRNVDFGISVSAADSLIEGNIVENFAGDGMRGLGDNTTFQYNTIKNCYDVNRNHDDGFQSWSRGENGRVGGGEVRGIVLRGNTIINFENPQQPHRGTLQGIGCFDGMFVDWVVENNVVITDHFHGITLSGARNCRIINNTVIDRREGGPGPPWIRIGNHKNGTPSTGCVVRNNLTSSLSVNDGVQVDHNLIVKDPKALFVDVSAFDLRPRSGSETIDAGSSELAPSSDAARTCRPQGWGIDVGAYEFTTAERP